MAVMEAGKTARRDCCSRHARSWKPAGRRNTRGAGKEAKHDRLILTELVAAAEECLKSQRGRDAAAEEPGGAPTFTYSMKG